MKHLSPGIITVLFVLASILAGCTHQTKSEQDLTVRVKDSQVEEIKSQSVEVASGIQFFEGSWEDALSKAKKEDKLIFLDAYAVWCGPCKKMAKNVFPEVEVGQFFNANFINFKMDMEKGIGPELSRKWELRAYPTLYFITGDGEPVYVSVGYLDARDLINIGKTAANY